MCHRSFKFLHHLFTSALAGVSYSVEAWLGLGRGNVLEGDEKGREGLR